MAAYLWLHSFIVSNKLCRSIASTSKFLSLEHLMLLIQYQMWNTYQLSSYHYYNNLPLTINVCHRCYKLGGCTMNTGGHFVTILLWHDTPYFYDGIRSTISNNDSLNTSWIVNLVNCTGSYAYYFLINHV